MNRIIGIPYISLKSKLSTIKKKLSKNEREKTQKLIDNTNPYKKELVAQLCQKGYKNIHPYSLSTWKYYEKDQVRLTFSAFKDSKKYIIKATLGCENKVNNSIRFQNMFNDVFDFIPRGSEITLKNYVAYATEFIPSYPFSWAPYFIDKTNASGFLAQINRILDELNKNKIVHCDLEAVNILVSKKDKKLYIIDWDTVCCDDAGLNCYPLPLTIKRKTDDGKVIYDDAYSIYTLIKRLNMSFIEKLPEFKELGEKVNRNIHISDI